MLKLHIFLNIVDINPKNNPMGKGGKSKPGVSVNPDKGGQSKPGVSVNPNKGGQSKPGVSVNPNKGTG